MAAVPAPPVGWKRLTWLGPGFLWMVSAAGSGELLFTPRVGALYGYALLWAMIVAIVLKWVINREVGRFAVCTGTSLIAGFTRLPRAGRWAVWIVVAPQLLVAVAAVAGMAGSAATALILVLPGDVRIWMTVSLLAATALVFRGHYKIIERTATAIGTLLALTTIAAAASVGPAADELIGGLQPAFPAEADYAEILPWLGFMLSGAAGMVWYSYWVPSKRYASRARAIARGTTRRARYPRKSRSACVVGCGK
jgi:Mn2+/Fe2+ NRAMP family transporter